MKRLSELCTVVIIFILSMCGCAPTVSTLEYATSPVAETTDTSPPTSTELINTATLEITNKTENAILTYATATESSTPTQLKVTDSPTPTQAVVIDLDFCQTTRRDICIGSIHMIENPHRLNMIIVITAKPQEENYQLLFDGIKYECVPIAGFTDRYFCPGLPYIINENVFIQIYSSGSPTPLAEGNVFLDQALMLKPTPTIRSIPTPKNPYQP